MRIGIVLPSNPSYSETFFRNKIEGLQSKGVEVTLFVKTYTPKGKDLCRVIVHPKFHNNALLRLLQTLLVLSNLFIIAPKATSNIIRITLKNNYSWLQAFKAAAIGASILPKKLDWLHFGYATTALEREYAAKAIGAKMAVSFRGYDISVVPNRNKSIYAKLFANVNKVHTISTDLLDQAYDLGLSKDIDVQKICPAINVNDFSSDENTDSKGAITVGRLHWKKGGEYTLSAFEILKRKGITINYSIIGDGVELERLKYTSYQYDLDYVNFLGKRKHDEIPALLNSHEMYIQYSIQEGFCNSVLEAQAMGLLCIVSDAEGLAENVMDGVTGWVVPKREPALLAKKIEEVLKLSTDEKNKIREAAKLRIKNNFNLQKQRLEFLEFYGA